MLVRISNAKYREPGVVKTYSEALEMLITEKIIPNYTVDPWQGFRNKELWTIEVNDLLEANLESLKKVFGTYKTSIKKHMEESDCLQMCQMFMPEIMPKEVQYCFAMSKMAVTSEPLNYKQY